MIRQLLTGATYEDHGSRFRFYADTPLNVTEEIRELSRTRQVPVKALRGSDARFEFKPDSFVLQLLRSIFQGYAAAWIMEELMGRAR
ncbi:hypothetical protein PC119_g9225 [Phytophthora cactorum]|nr:hypothetical protein PC111_g20243 [Phytophthora cactorum]KAG3022560.1 hypothetical protein PC119_g9225 [Phytophthora cactorum]